MKKYKSYIVQESQGGYEYIDVIETSTINLAKKYLQVLKDKYPTKRYRLVRWEYYYD